MRDTTWWVLLIKSKEPNPSGRSWCDSDKASASDRVDFLVALHGLSSDDVKYDEDKRIITLDASEWYS